MAVIAINTRLVVPGRLDGIGWFTLETVQRIVSAHPEHEFHLFFDRTPPTALFPGENVHCPLGLAPGPAALPGGLVDEPESSPGDCGASVQTSSCRRTVF